MAEENEVTWRVRIKNDAKQVVFAPDNTRKYPGDVFDIKGPLVDKPVLNRAGRKVPKLDPKGNPVMGKDPKDPTKMVPTFETVSAPEPFSTRFMERVEENLPEKQSKSKRVFGTPPKGLEEKEE